VRADAEFLPLTGSPARLDALASSTARSAAALEATRSDLLRLERALDQQRSSAVDAARAVVEGLRADVALADDVLRTVSGELSGRAAALAQEQRDAAAAIARRDAAVERLAQAEADEAAAWQRATTDAWPAEATRLVWDARARATDARAGIAAAEADWRRARDAKEGGSRWVAGRLGTLEHVGAVRLAAAAGIGAAAFATSWQVGRTAAASLGDVPARLQSGAPDPSLLTTLRGLGDDPVAWRAFWEHADATAVYRAFAGAVPGSQGADMLREGLAVLAAGSTTAEQEALGRRLVEGLGTQPHTAGAEAVLLAGMLGGSLPVAVHAGAADALAEHAARPGHGLVDSVTVTAPVAQVVAEGLAADPERALEHLAADGSEKAAQRAAFWFGDTPQLGWADGGAAVSALLASAVVAGTSPAASMERRNAASTAISAATPQLVRPTGLLGGTVRAEVEVNVVRAFEPYIPSFGDTVSPEDGRTGLAVEPGYVEPDLDPLTLCTVIAATSRTASGTDAWFGARDRYLSRAEALLEVAPADSGGRDEVILGAGKDAIVIDGAIRSDDLQAAGQQQAFTRGAVWTVSTAVGVATLGSSVPIAAAVVGGGAALPFVQEHLGADAVSRAEDDLNRTGSALAQQFTDRLISAAREADVAAGHDPDDRVRGLVPSTLDEELQTAFMDAADVHHIIDPQESETS
jgi:hypothetical protein